MTLEITLWHYYYSMTLPLLFNITFYFPARKENSITIMLVAMVTGFIYFNMLAFVNNIFELLDFHTIITGYYTLMVEGSTFLVCINGASTIIIYLLFSSKYRIIASKVS